MPDRALRLIVLLGVFNALFNGLRLTLSLKALASGAGAAEVGLVTGMVMVVPALCGHWVGRWSDVAGHRQPALAGAATMAAGAMLAGFASSIQALCLASVLIGSGYIVVSITTNSAIGQLSTESTRRRVFGAIAISFSTGAMAGPFVFGHAVHMAGDQLAFLCGGVATLLSCLGFLGPDATRPAARGPASGYSSFRLLTDRRLVPAFAANVACSLAWDLFVFLFPLIGSAASLPASQVGSIVATFAAGGLVSRVVLPLVPASVGEWTLLRGSFLVCASGYAALIVADSPTHFAAIAFATGLAAGLGLPVVLSILHTAAPSGRTGEALGIRASITSAGQFAMSLTFGALTAAVGFVPVLTLGAVLMVVSAAIRSR